MKIPEAWKLKEELTVEYSKNVYDTDLAESTILVEHVEKFETCLNVLGYESFGYVEFDNGQIGVIHCRFSRLPA